METIFFEISIVLIVGTLFATIAKFLRQPSIPAYILAGVLLGPPVFNVIRTGELLETLSTFGIAFLLFLVGIQLDLRKFLKTSRVAIIVGVVQMVFAVGVGYVLVTALGFSSATAFFLSVALGFSSTIVVMKLLGERRELDSLFGQLVIGVMLTQDFIAVLFLILFGVFTESSTGVQLASEVIFALVKGAFLFTMALLFSRYVLAHVFKYFARSAELLFLGAISWNLIFAMLSIWLGFSIEVGSLLAGVSLSFLPYSIEISNRIASLRDFFLPIFFAVLGGQLIFSAAESVVVPALVLSAFVLFASPVLVVLLLLMFGYGSRTSFQTGVSIGQVSEFSFVLVSLGLASGVIEQYVVGLVALIGLVTMTLSTYMIEYTEQMYIFFRPFLKRFERKGILRDDLSVEALKDHVVLFGHHTMGYKARRIMQRRKMPIMVIDHNPSVIEQLKDEGIPHLYGSITDGEVLEHARLADAQMIISTIPDKRSTLHLLEYLKRNKITTPTVVTAFHLDDALHLYERGASYVLYPTSLSADYFGDLLDRSLTKKRDSHIKELKKLQQLNLAS